LVAAHPTEAVNGCAVLDPLGYHRESKVMGKFDGRADDRGIAVRLCVAEALDEASIDLKLGDRELAEVAEG
jgi:hypothetical protein